MVNNIKKLQLDMTIKWQRDIRGTISCVVVREVLPDKGIIGQRIEWRECWSHGTFWGESIPGRGNPKYRGPAVGNTQHVQGTVRAQGPSVSGIWDTSIWLSSDDTLSGSLSLPHLLSSLTPSFFVTRFHISFNSEVYPFYVFCKTVTWRIIF